VPFAESLGALVELKDEGKILHIGLSNVTVDELQEAQSITSTSGSHFCRGPPSQDSRAMLRPPRSR
jgi:pyridoxine 4-dehydrogenase